MCLRGWANRVRSIVLFCSLRFCSACFCSSDQGRGHVASGQLQVSECISSGLTRFQAHQGHRRGHAGQPGRCSRTQPERAGLYGRGREDGSPQCQDVGLSRLAWFTTAVPRRGTQTSRPILRQVWLREHPGTGAAATFLRIFQFRVIEKADQQILKCHGLFLSQARKARILRCSTCIAHSRNPASWS